MRGGLPGTDTAYRSLSLWHETAGEDWTPRPTLPGDTEVDVAIVGAGFTGLWTAYYLLRHAPGLQVLVLEAEVAGFGASGRNGGWCSALFPTSEAALRARHGEGPARGLRLAMHDAVDEVGRVCAREGIDAHYVKGGSLVAARTKAQLRRAQAEVAGARALGIGPEDLDLLGADEARARLGATSALGATTTPHCARIHPARLVRGLARAVERLGGVVHERTPVTALRAGQVDTPHGRVRARHVLRATEGFTAGLPGARRDVAPVYSLMIATEPLPASFWATAGLARAETFSDHRHLIIYGQRTADDRLAFGGRGAPYHFGSGIRPAYDRSRAVHVELERTLRELFPPSPTTASRTRGAGRSASPATGWPRWCTTRRPASARPAATSETASARPTWPAARSPTSSSGATPSAPGCPGSATAPGRGSRSPCGGWRSTPGCAWPAPPTSRSGSPAAPPASAPCSAR